MDTLNSNHKEMNRKLPTMNFQKLVRIIFVIKIISIEKYFSGVNKNMARHFATKKSYKYLDDNVFNHSYTFYCNITSK